MLCVFVYFRIFVLLTTTNYFKLNYTVMLNQREFNKILNKCKLLDKQSKETDDFLIDIFKIQYN